MIRTQIYLPQSQLDFLRTRASKHSSTISEEIRQAIECIKTPPVLKTKPQPTIGKGLQHLLKHASKLKYTGPNDLATNMDKYLYGDPQK